MFSVLHSIQSVAKDKPLACPLSCFPYLENVAAKARILSFGFRSTGVHVSLWFREKSLQTPHCETTRKPKMSNLAKIRITAQVEITDSICLTADRWDPGEARRKCLQSFILLLTRDVLMVHGHWFTLSVSYHKCCWRAASKMLRTHIHDAVPPTEPWVFKDELRERKTRNDQTCRGRFLPFVLGRHCNGLPLSSVLPPCVLPAVVR